MQGWICLYRSITETELWQETPFDRARAWIDLLLMANHKHTQFLFGNELVSLDRGQFITSELKLCDRWKWGRKKVQNFFKLLVSMEMIEKKSTTKYTTITILNYAKYQDLRTTNDTAEEQRGNNEGTAEEQRGNNEGTQTTMYNNEVTMENHVTNNENNGNQEVNTLSSKLDHSDVVTIIDYLNERANTHYRPTSKKTVALISARMKEGFTVDDFKVVIEKKCYDWLDDGEWSQYLRPETLFGTKFESYLNQQQPVKKSAKKKAINDLNELYNELGAKQ